MTLLTSETEIEQVYSTIGVNLREDDLGDVSDMMADIIEAASETLESYTLQYYNSSDLANSKWARRRATIIACYYLSMRRANGTQYSLEYQRIMEELEKFLGPKPPIIPGVPVRASQVPTLSTQIVDDRYRYKKLRKDRNYSTHPVPGEYPYIQPLANDYF